MIVKHLLIEGGGVMAITHDAAAKTIQVRIDRAKIRSHGLPALNSLLLRLHVWYCTADVEPLRELVERLGTVDGDIAAWWETAEHVQARNPDRGWWPQANTFLADDGHVEYREYSATHTGLIRSFFERGI